MTLLIAVVILVAGLLTYVIASNAKVAEIGRILFFVAALAIVAFGVGPWPR